MNQNEEVRSQAVTDWGAEKPQCYVHKDKRTTRDGPDWGTGPYKGTYAKNKHTGKPMYYLRSTAKQSAEYIRMGKIEHVYSDQIDKLVKIQMKRIAADQQVIIVIEDAFGNGTGSGKSMQGLILATTLQRAMHRSFILSRDLIFDEGNFIGRVKYGGENGILVLDEAHQIVGSQRASGTGARILRECFNTLRSKHNITIMVTPRLSGLASFVENEILDIRIDCSNPQKSWVSGIGRGLFQAFVAERKQTFGGQTKRERAPFWNMIFTGIFHPKMLPDGMWDEYMVFKNKFQAMMLDRSIKKVEMNDEDALAYIKSVYKIDELTPKQYDNIVDNKPKAAVRRKRGRPFGSKDSYKRKVNRQKYTARASGFVEEAGEQV